MHITIEQWAAVLSALIVIAVGAINIFTHDKRVKTMTNTPAEALKSVEKAIEGNKGVVQAAAGALGTALGGPAVGALAVAAAGAIPEPAKPVEVVPAGNQAPSVIVPTAANATDIISAIENVLSTSKAFAQAVEAAIALVDPQEAEAIRSTVSLIISKL